MGNCQVTNINTQQAVGGIHINRSTELGGRYDAISARIDMNINKIKDWTFYECINLRSVYIPDSVQRIGESAFSKCSSLSSLQIPYSVQKIGKRAFYNCVSLQSITISQPIVENIDKGTFLSSRSVTIIDNEDFQGCYSPFDSIATVDAIREIGEESFSGCSLLQSITIPESVEKIGDKAFYNCISLTSIVIPEFVKEIGKSAFSSCSSLKHVNISSSVKTIGDAAFTGCSSLQSIIIPELVETIGECAFRNCFSLQSIIIPESVRMINSSAFENCSSLTSVSIRNNSIKILCNAFTCCLSLISILMPNSDTLSHHSTFLGCIALNQRRTNDISYQNDTGKWLQHRFDNLPIHQACYDVELRPATLSTLISENKDSLALTDAMNMTALHVLCCNPSVTAEMIEMLISAHPETINMKNVVGMDPLMVFLKCNSMKKVEEVDSIRDLFRVAT